MILCFGGKKRFLNSLIKFMHSDALKISEYSITSDTSWLDNKYKITPEIQHILEDIYPDVIKGKEKTIKKLKRYCKKYPHIPHFKNYLSGAYENAGNLEKASDVNHQIIREHPDYLFGKLNYASMLLEEGNPDKVPEILGEEMDLKALYPGRETFHFREVLGFLKVCVRYYLAMDNLNNANACLEIMQEIGPEEPETDEAFNRWTRHIMEGAAHRLEEENKRRRSVESRSYDKSVQTSEKPSFTHSKIEALYSNDMRIDHEIVREILDLPRETLISDLETVVRDSINRFEYLRECYEENEEWDENEFCFILHALFLLAELRAEDFLPVILRLLRQGEELLDFWFSDVLEDVVWEVVYHVGQNRLSDLQSFMKEPDNYVYARSSVHTAVAQLALHQPDRRAEVIRWFEELFRFFLENEENDRVIDTDLISFMIWDCTYLKATELEEIIRKLYARNLVEPGITGTVEEVLRDMKSGQYQPQKYPVYDIFSRYDHLSEQWYPEEDDMDFLDLFSSPLYENDDFSLPAYNQPVQTDKDIGRNGPCPCGSGKKYKHCCLN